MTLTRKDAIATVLTALAVAAFVATHEGWNVWLIGGSHRWAAAAILLLGIGTCAQGSAGSSSRKVSALLGTLAGVLGIVALATGSLTPLSLLVVDIVVLWTISTVDHATHAPHTPHPV
jgi:hypothetical protein